MKSPFKFLDSYSKDDKDIFFGREKDVEEVYEKLFKSNLLLVYGASGTGKTSLLNCGIANKFQNTDWFPLHIRRRNDILESSKKEIEKFALTPLVPDMALAEAFHSLYLDFFKPIYIIFDQFEELFISGKLKEQNDFINFLVDLLQRGYNLKVIITIREEYIANFSSFEERIPNFFDNRYRVEHMTPLKAEEVIIKTCRKTGISMTEERPVAKSIISNISSGTSHVELTYLQVYLDRLYNHYQKKGDIPVIFSGDLLKEVGGISDVLALFLEEQISRTKEPELGWQILKAFITAGGTKKTTSIESIQAYFREKQIEIDSNKLNEYLNLFLQLKIIKYLDE